MANKPKHHQYIKYSSIGIQMVAYVLIMAWLGYKADGWLEMEKPYLLAAGALLGCVFAMIFLIKVGGKSK